MNPGIQPLRAERFLKAALAYMESLKGTHIYSAITRDFMEKTDQVDAGYGRWLQRSLTYLVEDYKLRGQPRVLDFGCGTGELTVRINTLGFRATGVDIHERHLELARILAEENGLPKTTFFLTKDTSLPFSDNSFDIVTMFVVLEHLDDATLVHVLPELNRVCCGVIYVLVPNKLQTRDAHTGLLFVPWMPRWLATRYIRAYGDKRRYWISSDGSWDVHYRGFYGIISLFRKQGFDFALLAEKLIYPPLDVAPPIVRIGKNFRLLGKTIFVGVRLPYGLMIKLGYKKEAFYPYLNIIFQANKKDKCL